MEKIFSGELRKIEPEKIIKLSDNNNFDKFFLILGLIFNDLKSSMHYSLLLEDQFKNIDKNNLDCDFGEYHGMKDHLNRLITSIIHEFFVFLEKQSRVISSYQFEIELKKLTSTKKQIWKQLLEIANKENLTSKGLDFLDTLKCIRNNGSFHYYSSGDSLRNGFIDHFYYRKDEHSANKIAYYSRGDIMHDTRYFYCDAAVGGFRRVSMNNKFNTYEHHEALVDIAGRINIAIEALMKIYLSSRK